MDRMVYSSIILCCLCISIVHYIVNLWHFEKRTFYFVSPPLESPSKQTQISNFNKAIKLIKFCTLAWKWSKQAKMMKRLTIHSSWIITQVKWNRKESANEQQEVLIYVKYAHETAYQNESKHEHEHEHGHGWLTHDEQTKWTIQPNEQRTNLLWFNIHTYITSFEDLYSTFLCSALLRSAPLRSAIYVLHIIYLFIGYESGTFSRYAFLCA